MAFIYETYAEQKISAEANAMTEYIMKIRGIVPNYGNAFNLGSTGTILKIDQGMLVYTGRKAINNALEEIEVLPETLGTRTKYINVTLDGSQQPTANSATFTISNTSAGSITSKTEDLMDNLIGSVSFELGTFTNTTSGIDNSSLQLTCPIILRRSLEELNDKFGNYLPLAGGTMSGSINMNNNFIYLRSGVSIQSPSAGRINLTGNIYTDAINTQGKRIDTVGGIINSGGGNINTLGGPLSCYRILLHDTNGANGEYMISYRDTTSFNVLRTMYTQAINTQGNAISTDGGAINANGGGLSGNSLFLHDSNGLNGSNVLTYRSNVSFNVLRTMFAREIRTQGSKLITSSGDIELGSGNLLTGGGNVDTSNGDVLLGTGNLRTTGRAYFNSTNYDQIVLENATGVTGTKTFKLTHNTGPTAGILSWDRSINGQNACYFNMISLTEGEPYNGLRMVEDQRVYSYGNAKFLVEAATLFATQVSNLEVSLSLQDQIDIINNSMQTMRSEIDLLKLQMEAIINGDPIPTELPPIAMLRTAEVEVTFADNLRSKLEEAQAELDEQNYQDEYTVVDDQIKFMEKDLEAVNVKQTRTISNVDAKFELLNSLKAKREQIKIDYGKGEL